MRPRFSLRTFLITVAFLGAACGLFAVWRQGVIERAERHDRAVKQLAGMVSSHRGEATFWTSLAQKWIHPSAYAKSEFLNIPAKWENLQTRLPLLNDVNGIECIQGELDNLSLSDAKLLYGSPDLNQVVIRVNKTAEPGCFAFIASRPKMKTLWIMSPIDDETAIAIANNPTLENVIINGESLTTEQLRAIAKSRQITHLGFEEITLDADFVHALKDMTQLSHLNLMRSQITQQGIEEVSQLKLTRLSISGGKNLPCAIKPLSKIHTLKKLSIDVPCERAEGDLVGFAECPDLEEISLRSIEIDAASLEALNRCPRLTKAAFRGDLPQDEISSFTNGRPGGRRLELHSRDAGSSQPGPDSVKSYGQNAKGN